MVRTRRVGLGVVRVEAADPPVRLMRSMQSSAEKTTHTLLVELMRALADRPDAGDYLPGVALQDLLNEVRSLAEADRPIFDELTADLRPTVRSISESLEATASTDIRGTRDLITVVRRLRVVIDNAFLGTPKRRLPREELTVEYAAEDLARLVRNVSDAFTALARERRLTYHVRVPPTLAVEIDPHKVQLALLNLLFNAFKYTREGGSVRCTLAEAPGGDDVLLRVVDSGPGVPASQREAIFDRSRQIDRSVSLLLSGLTLSLGTSRDLIGLHGGSLTLDRSSGSGAAFEIRVPRRAPHGLPVSAAYPVDPGVALQVAETATRELRAEQALESRAVVRDSRPLVLVVEDSRSIQRIVLRCLEKDYNVASAFDGVVGLERALALRPDLMLIDVMLPEMDGESVIRAARQSNELRETPILVVTGSGDPARLVRLLEGGVQDVLHKPFLLPELRARVQNLVSAKRARDVLTDMLGRRETDLVTLAGEVRSRQEHLERALVELEQAKQTAEAANLIKSNFLRMMSHELKTPLTALQLHLRVVERDPQSDLSESLREGLARIGRSSRRLRHLVDTVLEWARVESRRSHLAADAFSLGEAVDDVVHELLDYARHKGIDLVVKAPTDPIPVAATDQRLLRLVLLNLLYRAIQITDGCNVVIAYGWDPEGFHVAVSDGAPPISDEDRAEVFDPLPLAHDLHRRSGPGSGLGLHVVRDLARALCGDISFQPDIDHNVLVVRFPALVIAAPIVPPQQTSAQQGSKP